MSQLKEQYEKETGTAWHYHHSMYLLPAEGYVNWLEAKVEKIKSHNTGITNLPEWEEIKKARPPAPADWGTDEETSCACMEYGAQSAYDIIVRQLRNT